MPVTPLQSTQATTTSNENIKTSQFIPRQKRPLTCGGGGATASPLVASAGVVGGGILFPYLKNILYTLHLVYEECKLYRSLCDKFCTPLVQIQYLLAAELGLSLYMNYYEQEYPALLLKLKGRKLFATKHQQQQKPLPPVNIGLPSTIKSSLSYLISQEPPVLCKFLNNLVAASSSGDIINPFPVISSVSKRTIKAIKIYAIISLLAEKPNAAQSPSYEEFLNQLFFKVNFTGYSLSASSSLDLTNSQNNNNNNPILNSSFQASQSVYTLKFTFKPGASNVYENIFSLCLEMGLCTLNEIYDYPFSVLFPVLESINWSREHPCLTWPVHAFDLIGRNDLAILKANSDLLTVELAMTAAASASSGAKSSGDNDDNNEESAAFRQQYMSSRCAQNQTRNVLSFDSKKRPVRSAAASGVNGAQSSLNWTDENESLTLNFVHNGRSFFSSSLKFKLFIVFKTEISII